MEIKKLRTILKNKEKRALTKKLEMKKMVFKYLSFNKYNNINFLINLYYLQKYTKYSSISVINNICVQTGRSRSVSSFFKLSRMKLKELGNFGLLPGLRRSS
jgi:small subunit ribosomal protein S14